MILEIERLWGFDIGAFYELETEKQTALLSWWMVRIERAQIQETD